MVIDPKKVNLVLGVSVFVAIVALLMSVVFFDLELVLPRG
jgi:hypothetical protein